jgi:hypothetical protein
MRPIRLHPVWSVAFEQLLLYLTYHHEQCVHSNLALLFQINSMHLKIKIAAIFNRPLRRNST